MSDEDPTPHVTPPSRIEAEQRKAILAQAVAENVTLHRARVESQTDFQAVLVRGHRINHLLHLILTLLTCGVWVVVWVAMFAFAGEKRFSIRVDEYGQVHLG